MRKTIVLVVAWDGLTLGWFFLFDCIAAWDCSRVAAGKNNAGLRISLACVRAEGREGGARTQRIRLRRSRTQLYVRSFVRRSLWQVGSRGEIGSSVNLMEQRSFGRVSQNVLNKSNIRHNNCRKQQILLLLLCCLNGSSKESRCWTRRRRVAFDLPSNVLEGNRNALAGNISRELETKTYLTVLFGLYVISLAFGLSSSHIS